MLGSEDCAVVGDGRGGGSIVAVGVGEVACCAVCSDTVLGDRGTTFVGLGFSSRVRANMRCEYDIRRFLHGANSVL